MSILAYFSPDGGAEAKIVSEINRAHPEIYGLLNMYQSDPIHDALIAALDDGALIGLVFDRRMQFLEEPRIDDLIAHGCYVGFDKHEPQLHSQWLMAYNYWTCIGSYLYTYTSELRYVDTLLWSDEGALYQPLIENWMLHWDHSEQMIP